MMHGEDWSGGWWLFGHGGFGILIWIAVLLAIVWLIKQLPGPGNEYPEPVC